MARNRTRRDSNTPIDNGPATHNAYVIKEEKRVTKMDQNEISNGGATLIIPTLEVGSDMLSTMTEFQAIIIPGNQSNLHTDTH